MASFLPAEWLSPAALPSVVGPAYFVAAREDDAPLLVTGGDDPQAIILSGEHAGRSFRAVQGASRGGFAISGIEVQIDPLSFVDPIKSRIKPGNILVAAGAVSIYAVARAQYGFDDAFAWNVENGAATEDTAGMVGFTSWRICKRDRDALIEIAALRNSG